METIIEPFDDLLTGKVRKEEIDELFLEMAYNEELRYMFITFIRLTYAIKGESLYNDLKFVESTNRVFSKLGFELPGMEKEKSKKRLWRIFNYRSK
ncbi:hypothetical protein MASR1M45_28360 [Candidatus Kapaibacterium sp.]